MTAARADNICLNLMLFMSPLSIFLRFASAKRKFSRVMWWRASVAKPLRLKKLCPNDDRSPCGQYLFESDVVYVSVVDVCVSPR